MHLTPPRVPFLGSRACSAPEAVLIGAPLDLTESFHAGTSAGPERVRAVSDVLETYSPQLDRDLGELRFADWGDVECTAGMAPALDAIAAAVSEACRQGALPILLGGEHTATVGALRGALAEYPELHVVQLDAHADLRDDYEGVRMSHATVMRRIADEIGLARLCQCGIRSATREEVELSRRCLASSPRLELPTNAINAIGRHPVYLTIDIDVLDPAAAPGTGCPEPGGPSFAELASFISSLRELNVVALDVMEILPAVDVNDITSVAAAKLVRDAILLFSAGGVA
jgi:agmatinase